MRGKILPALFFLLILFSPLVADAKKAKTVRSYAYSGVVKEIDSLRSITIANGYKVYNVDATKAVMLTNAGGALDFSSIRIGDTLNLQGRMVWTTINATRLVDQSIAKNRVVLIKAKKVKGKGTK